MAGHVVLADGGYGAPGVGSNGSVTDPDPQTGGGPSPRLASLLLEEGPDWPHRLLSLRKTCGASQLRINLDRREGDPSSSLQPVCIKRTT